MPNIKGGIGTKNNQACGLKIFYEPQGKTCLFTEYDNISCSGGAGSGPTYGKGSTIKFDASNSNKIYKNNHNDVTPYNFNINLLVKI